MRMWKAFQRADGSCESVRGHYALSFPSGTSEKGVTDATVTGQGAVRLL